MSDTTFSKKSTGASPFFNIDKLANGVYAENHGRVNTPRDTPAGGEVRPSTIAERAGSHWRPSLVGDSPVR